MTTNKEVPFHICVEQRVQKDIRALHPFNGKVIISYECKMCKKDLGKSVMSTPKHNCLAYQRSDGGGIDPRYPGKVWITRYYCSLCGNFLRKINEGSVDP
jgi:hypothetical protein